MPAILKPTVSRESFWNHSINKWSHKNDDIICFIAILDVLVQKMVTKNTKKLGILDPPPPLFGKFS